MADPWLKRLTHWLQGGNFTAALKLPFSFMNLIVQLILLEIEIVKLFPGAKMIFIRLQRDTRAFKSAALTSREEGEMGNEI